MVWFYHFLTKYILECPPAAFNPTMVWFYPQYAQSSSFWVVILSIPLWSDFIYLWLGKIQVHLTDFQSHYGLILSRCTGWRNHRFSSFQSHYGLILSLQRPQQCNRITRPFNPTMVWFYHSYIHVVAYVRVGFQSHYGLILSQISKMQREIDRLNFQSHYGLILSSTSIDERAGDVSLSIPLWSDFI